MARSAQPLTSSARPGDQARDVRAGEDTHDGERGAHAADDQRGQHRRVANRRGAEADQRDPNASIDAIASDASFGLPAEGAKIASARAASTAVPADDGDLTVTMRRTRF